MQIRHNDSGYVLVVLAGGFVLLLGFAALAVDVGVLYSSHTSAQRAADAAALAGAFTFVTDPSADDLVTLATNRATKTAIQNQILGQTIQDSEVNVTVQSALRRVTVDVTHPVSTFFAKALLAGSATVHARATAETASTATGARCVKPWFIPNSTFAPEGVNACGACSDMGNSLVVIPPDNTANRDFINTQRGQLFTLKAGTPGGAIAPGQFYAIDIVDRNTGADIYRESIAGCPVEAGISCLGIYSTKTGNMQGPTLQGIEGGTNLVGRLLNSPSPDTWAGYTQGVASFYENGDTSRHVDTSSQMIVAPLWNVCTPTLDCSDPDRPKFPTGTSTDLQVVGFALLFIEGLGGNGNTDVLARLLDVQACGNTPPSPTEIGPFAVPLRLVRVPD
jgi:Flp pilus assembly protein TadG